MARRDQNRHHQLARHLALRVREKARPALRRTALAADQFGDGVSLICRERQ
jgi:hypothetical protein